ncbi:zinc finger protein 830 isoform X1 [Zerene cesonia]|uniref:zinc finger protein 830 isoform X1 n=1 Tax=Zerene cesonia TaxID=33412 RepID=UPI0018E52624|nr:zinc finger protein 830 isoform X1 [Zerene cesonia]
MSLKMQVEKKRAQDEMRKLMSERKNKDKKPVQIQNPLAKYNGAGQLTCVLCSSIVRSENVWQVHVNSKQHRNNVEQAKKLKELTKNFTDGNVKKRLATSTPDAPQEKKIKGILKNATENKPANIEKTKNDAPIIYSHHDEHIKRKPLNLPNEDVGNEIKEGKEVVEGKKAEEEAKLNRPIPEGFFDDPILDAKARNIEYKDPVEEEWEKFQKEIKEEATTSAEIIAGEQEEATAERQIDEIDEQIRNWSRVLDLELKKEETKKKVTDMEVMDHSDNNDSDSEADINEFLDWRAKKSYS